MIDVLHDLHIYLEEGIIPHYFLPKCNILATVEHDELQIALQAIQTILSDPVVAILKCPSEPDEIFGDICPDEIVAIFNRVSVNQSYGRNREDLIELLSQLDEHRRKLYPEQLQADDSDGCVSGRPELTGLVDMLLTHWGRD